MTEQKTLPFDLKSWSQESDEWLAEAAALGLKSRRAISRESGIPYDTLTGIFRRSAIHEPSNKTRQAFKAMVARLRAEQRKDEEQ